MNIKLSVETQARVFNVECDDSYMVEDFEHMVKNMAPKYCNVEINKGWKKHRRPAIGFLEALRQISNLHFYKYKTITVTEERLIPIAKFYEKPFSMDYVSYIGATFFNSINKRIIKEERKALSEVIPATIHLAKSGSYYCWAKLDYRWTTDGKFELCIVQEEEKKVVTKEEYV